MRITFLAFLLFLCTFISAAPGINENIVGSSQLPGNPFEPTIQVTGFGIDLVSNGICTPGGNPADCTLLDNMTELHAGPGADIALYLEWTNDGVTTFIEVAITDGNGEQIIDNVTTPLGPGESASAIVFFTAPVVPGQYVVPITLTATNGDNRQGTTLVRYTLNVDASLPVGLQYFTASVTDKQSVALAWATAWEEHNSGFTIERKSTTGDFAPLPGTPSRETLSAGTTSYHFLDEAAPVGNVFYRLQQVDLSGRSNYSPIVRVKVFSTQPLPYPNPVTNRLYLPEVSGASLYDAMGRRVLNQITAQEWMEVSHLPVGTYWVKLNGEMVPIVKQ